MSCVATSTDLLGISAVQVKSDWSWKAAIAYVIVNCLLPVALRLRCGATVGTLGGRALGATQNEHRKGPLASDAEGKEGSPHGG